MDAFNFDRWSELYKANPQEFEKQKKAALMALVETAPEASRPKLMALVNQLCVPVKASPMEQAVHAQNLMMESLTEMQRHLAELVRGFGQSAPSPNAIQQFTTLEVKKRSDN